VAEKPRNSSCLSVVSLNSTIHRAQPFIISYFGFGFTNAYSKILFCRLFSHKQDSLTRGAAAFVDRGRQTTTHKCYNVYSTVEVLTTRDGPSVVDAKARYRSKITIFIPVRVVPVGLLP